MVIVLPVACSAYLLASPRTTCQKMVPAIVSWARPHQSLIRKRQINLSTGQFDGGDSSVEVPSFQIV